MNMPIRFELDVASPRRVEAVLAEARSLKQASARHGSGRGLQRPEIATTAALRALADLMTMQERSRKPLAGTRLCFVGDPRTPRGDAVLQAAALTGIDLRIAAPVSIWPHENRLALAQARAVETGGQISLHESTAQAAEGVDFVMDETAWLSHRPVIVPGADWPTMDVGLDENEVDNLPFVLEAASRMEILGRY